MSPEDYEEATNPEYFNFKVESIIFEKDSELLNDLTLKNISKINPKEIVFSKDTYFTENIRVLSSLLENTTVSFGTDFTDESYFKF